MLEQANVTIIFYGFYTASGVGKTGLTPTFTLYKDKTAAPVVSAANATELAGGFYYYEYAGTTEGFLVGKFITADATVDQKEIPAIMLIGKAGVENLDASISTRAAQDELDALKGEGWAGATDSLRGIRSAIAGIPSQRNTQEI